MAPIILGISMTSVVGTSITSFDDLINITIQAITTGASPGRAVFIIATGLRAQSPVSDYSVWNEAKSFQFTVKDIKDLFGVFSLSVLGLPTVQQVEVTIPDQTALKNLQASRYGPVIYTQLKIKDNRSNKPTDESNCWPLCIIGKTPLILGVTAERVSSGNPLTVYQDLLQKNVTTLIKGTTPGGVQRGASREFPRPDVYLYGCNLDRPAVMAAEVPSLKLLYDRSIYPRVVCTIELDISIGPAQKKCRFDLQEIGITLPTLAELQGSQNYLRNAVLMAFGVQVVNDVGRGETSNTWQWPMWLPMPVLQRIRPDKSGYGNGRYLGNESLSSGATKVRDKGEVRWYLGDPIDSQRRSLEKYLPGVVDDLQRIDPLPYQQLSQTWSFSGGLSAVRPNLTTRTLVLPSGLTTSLKTIREAGELCEVITGAPVPWADDTVTFRRPYRKCWECACGKYTFDPAEGDPDHGVPPWTDFLRVPTGWTCPACGQGTAAFHESTQVRERSMGFVVVWRGDVPSVPLPVNLIEYIKELARQLWRPALDLGMGDIDVPIPIPMGEPIKLGVERLEDLTNAVLEGLAKGGITVRFAFLTNTADMQNFMSRSGDLSGLGLESDANSLTSFIPDLEPGRTGVATKVVEFLYNPLAADYDDPPRAAFCVQLHVHIEGQITVLGQQVTLTETFPLGPRLRFYPQPLDIPSVAIFFAEPDQKGTALVALQPGTGLFSGQEVHIDAHSDDAVNAKRKEFVDKLSGVRDALKVFRLLPGVSVPHLDEVISTLDEICALGRSVFDSFGRLANVSDSWVQQGWFGSDVFAVSFNDHISSAVLIGPPYRWTRKVVKCWEHSLNRWPNLGRCLRLTVPDNSVIFTVDNLSQALSDHFERDTLAANEKQCGVVLDFNDKITGIEFVQE